MRYWPRMDPCIKLMIILVLTPITPHNDKIDAEITIPEAVNLIMAVDIGDLKEFGRKLGVDEAKLNGLSEYVGIGRHQRLIEAWFEQARQVPSRNALLEALPRRGSSASMSSLPPTPTFEPPSGENSIQCSVVL